MHVDARGVLTPVQPRDGLDQMTPLQLAVDASFQNKFHSSEIEAKDHAKNQTYGRRFILSDVFKHHDIYARFDPSQKGLKVPIQNCLADRFSHRDKKP